MNEIIPKEGNLENKEKNNELIKSQNNNDNHNDNKDISKIKCNNLNIEKNQHINLKSNLSQQIIGDNENNKKEEINKQEENEEYEEDEDLAQKVEYNKEKINKNKNIIQELIFSNNSDILSNTNRKKRGKKILDPINSKNKSNKHLNKDINSIKDNNNDKSIINNLKKSQNLNNNHILKDVQNNLEREEHKEISQNQIQNNKYVLPSVKPHNNITNNNFGKNLIKYPTERPRTSLTTNLLEDNNSKVDLDKIMDYSEIYSNFLELFSGYFLSNNYAQKGDFILENTIGELYESFNKLYYYELNKILIEQKDEMYSDIVRAEAGVIINRIKHAQEKLLKEDDINTNIEKYSILRKCLELEKKNYAREVSDNNINNNDICKYKKFFRVVLSRPEIYDIVCYTLYKDSSWSELPHGLSLGQCWNLYWSYGPPHIDFTKLFSFQKVNHLINNRIVHRKDLLHKHIMKIRKLNKKCNEIFNIMPMTFLLSKEYINFVEEFHRIKDTKDYNIWIVKPVGKSRGNGIFLIDNISDVPLNDTFLVQKYLSNPLLLDEGYKFDMRIYCLVTSVNPLEMFLYKDGFARVSNELYSMDISNIKVHLTNAAIQNRQAKKSNNYEKIYGGSKISLDMLKYKLKKQYKVDFAHVIWPQVKDIITKVFICCQNDIPYCPSTFEMFGFDVIIDSNLKCWLLEINSSPSLERSNVLDDEIKLPLVKDIIKIIQPVEIDKFALINVLERFMKIKNNPKEKNAYIYNQKIQLNKDLTNIFYGKIPRKYGEKPKDMGRFEMICPNKETDKLIRIAGGQKYYNNRKEKNENK